MASYQPIDGTRKLASVPCHSMNKPVKMAMVKGGTTNAVKYPPRKGSKAAELRKM